jgi:hypothetical protein
VKAFTTGISSSASGFIHCLRGALTALFEVIRLEMTAGAP